MNIILWLQLPLFAGIFGGVAWMVVQQGRKTRANLQGIAGRLGLTATDKKFLGMATGLTLQGTVAGRELRFWTYTTSNGKSSTS